MKNYVSLDSKNGEIKVFAETIDQLTVAQIIAMANSPLGKDAHIRIMPDVHAGKGCVIGTTMHITDKVCPNIVGVDIGCGVSLMTTNIDFSNRLEELDQVIRKHIPYGFSSHEEEKNFDFTDLKCWNELSHKARARATCSLGTLGGGNHFIEAYHGGKIAVHSGSRNIGKAVSELYQSKAVKQCDVPGVSKDQAFLTGELMENYLHDIAIIQQFASENRSAMLSAIVENMGGSSMSEINSIHNFIDVHAMILRKGAISAKNKEQLVIPLNMRDGLLVCRGKGNDDWNCSAPHGAGRIYSRSQAKVNVKIEDYEKSMEGIYSTCISKNTLDESPFVYKNYEEIIRCIGDTVTIEERLIPIFNFKAN